MSDYGSDELYRSLVDGILANKKITFSQNFEDMRMSRAFHQSEGFFVDIGSAHPVDDNCTFLFDRMGWNGICVDAFPQRKDLYGSIRKRSELVTSLINDGKKTKFYKITHPDGSWSGLSTTSGEVAQRSANDGFLVTEIEIQGTTLNSLLLSRNVRRDFEVLSVDVEGTAIEAFSYGFFQNFRPKLICLESTFPRSPIKDDRLIGYVKSNGYVEVVHDGLNSFFVPNENIHEYGILAEHISPFIDGGFFKWQSLAYGHSLYNKIGDDE